MDQRGRNMAAIRSRDTKPELHLRRALHAEGYRFRIAPSGLPGRPDLTFPSRRRAIFVNGCFWHMHDCRYGNVTPKTNAEFWHAKRTATVARDTRKTSELEALGWKVLTVWECELRKGGHGIEKAIAFLEDQRTSGSSTR